MGESGVQLQTYDGIINSTAIQYAEDVVAGNYDDYVFFQYSQDSFCLIQSPKIETFDMIDDCTIHYFTAVYNQTEWGRQHIGWTYSSIETPVASVQVTGDVVYSSFGDYPKLRSMSDMQSYFQSVLLIGVIVCFFFMRIFRRVI